MNSAPAANLTSRIEISCPEGAPLKDGSVENEYWVLATHTGYFHIHSFVAHQFVF